MTETIGLEALFQTAQFQAGLAQYLNGINQATGATNQAAGSASSAGSVITGALGYALGTVVTQAASAAVSAIGNFISSGIESVGMLQRMQIMLESMAARELVASGAFSDIASAMGSVGPIADMLLQKLQALALASPFQYEDIVNVFRLNMAFGATAESALSVTQAILDMAAAMGLSGSSLERIVYNFSQMQMIGKISARDIRDLAMAGVDLAAVLREQLGMSIDEVNAALEKGTLTMKDVTDAFVAFSQANFAGAAERMSLTLQGLGSSFKDLMFFASKDLFGPLVEKLTVDLGALFQSAKQLLDSGVLKGIGESLASAYDAMKNIPAAIGQVISSLNNLFGSGLKRIISNAFDWGVQIIANLAAGIMDGIAQFLVAAMDAVSAVLSYWLSPGSPPKVAPNIDKWGAAAMEEFLGGFSDADFSALDSLQNALSSAFSALNIDDTQGVMADLSQQFAVALSTNGTLDQGFFDQLASAAGPYGNEIARLAQLNLDLSNSTEAVALSEKKAAEARAIENQARQKSASLISEYNDLLKSGASEDVLQAKLDEVNAQEQIAADAADQRKAAEDDLTLQKTKVDLLSQQVDLQQKLIEQLTSLYAIQDQGQTDTGAGGTGDTSGGGGGGGSGGGAGAGATGGSFISDLQNMLNQAQGIVDQSSNNMRDTIFGKLASIFEPIMAAWQTSILPRVQQIQERFIQFVADIQQKWAAFSAEFIAAFTPVANWWNQTWPLLQQVFSIAWEGIKNVFSAAWAAIQPSLDQLRIMMDQNGISMTTLSTIALSLGQILIGVVAAGAVFVVSALVALVGVLVSVASGFINAITVSNQFVVGMTSGFTQMLAGLGQVFQGFFNLITSVMTGNLDLMLAAFKSFGEALINIAAGSFGAIVNIVILPFSMILGFIGGFVKGVLEFFRGLSDELVGHSIVPDMMDDLVEVIKDGFDDLLDIIGDFASQTEDGFTDWVTTLLKIINDGLTQAIAAITNRYTQLYTYGANIINKIAEGAQSRSGYLGQVLSQVVLAGIGGLASEAGNMAYDIGIAIVDGVEAGMKARAQSFLDYCYDFGKNIMTNIEEGMTDYQAGPRAALITLLNYMTDVANTYQSDFYQLGRDLMQAMGAGIAAETPNVVSQINSSMDEIISAIQAKIDAQSNAAAAVVTLHAAQAQAVYSSGRNFAAPVSTISNNRTLNAPMQVNIYGQMDERTFADKVRRVIRAEFGV